ncbi:MAG: FeoB small GTPase domain-containing protein [Desulfopila sp.]
MTVSDTMHTTGDIPSQSGPVKMCRYVLIGNMNVGKTSIFNSLTTKKVRPVNIPGSTVAVCRGEIKGGRGILYDTPGLASIFSNNEDERAARRIVLGQANGYDNGRENSKNSRINCSNDCSKDCGGGYAKDYAKDYNNEVNGIIIVADAKNLKRSIAIALQYGEFGLPILLNINMMDEASSRGITIDKERLAELMGVEVTTTIAPEGIGIRELRAALGDLRPLKFAVSYPPPLEKLLQDVKKVLGGNHIAPRGIALLLLHHDMDARRYVESRYGAQALKKCVALVEKYYEDAPNHDRHLLAEMYNTIASRITAAVQVAEPPPKSSLLMKFGDMCTAFSTGIPIAVLVLLGMYFFIGEFGATYLVDTVNSKVFEGVLFPLVSQFTDRLPSPFVRDMIMDPDFGILPTGVFLALGLVLPVIFCFYIAFGILEDSGYLPRISILLDTVFQKLGLNGKGVIPLVMGFSCVTMALLTTRVLNNDKEKNIVSFLLYLCMPCAPLIAVMLIILEKMPVSATITVFGIIFSQVIVAGYLANRILPGERSPLLLEIPPMRLPKPLAVLKMAVAKTYFFMLEALPVFIIASLGVFLFERVGGLGLLERTLGPMIHHVMGLPEKSVQVFIKTMIRRESGAAELEHIRHMYTNLQLVVNLLVMTFVAPCINSFIVLFKERGIKAGLVINVGVFLWAILVGSLVNNICLYLGVSFS